MSATWHHYLERITVIDALESGACLDGVIEWVVAHGGTIAGETQKHAKNGYIARAANGYGYGYGDGYGYGYGYGDGDGSGDGSGDGDG